MFLGLKLEQWLAFTVVAAIISTVGSLLGIVIRDYFFSRAHEKWKQKRALEQLYLKYSNPLLASSKELVNRLIEILDDYPPNYLKKEVLDLRPVQFDRDQLEAKSTNDPYFRRYKLVSTAYRFSSFFAWLELYRQEMVFLDSGNNTKSKHLEQILNNIRRDVADGQLNGSDNWLDWNEYLIFREEIRAIGEFMLENNGTSKSVMGYKKFYEILQPQDSLLTNKWISHLFNLFIDFQQTMDFRKCRITLLLVNLVDLIDFLDSSKLEKRYIEARLRYKSTLSEYPLDLS